MAARLAAEGQAERAAGLAALEGLAGAYAAQALARLGPEPNGARVAARHVRLVRRLAEIAGQARRRGQSEGVIPGGADLPRETARLAAAFPAAREELALVQRCGERLERVLTGEEDPLERLFPGGDPAGLLPLYRDAAPFRAANRLVAEALAEVRERRGREGPRALRVLEVGAGTGATTLAALPALGPFVTEYVFTDVSGLFLRKARESLGEHPALRFALFDAEAPPESQDLAPGRFDVVLAANALHATRDLRQALGHVRRLLAPDGVLVLAELVAPRGWLDLTFGLLPGWWRFEDAPLRTESPLLSLAAWSAALAESGFAAPVAVPLEGPGADALGAAVLVARSAPVEAGMSGAESLAAPAVREGRRWLVLTDGRGADQGGTGQALVARLRAEGDHCVAVTAGPGFGVRGLADLEAAPDRPGDLAEAIRRATPQGGRLDGVVSLWALDAGEASGSPGGDVAAAAEEATAAALHLAQALLSPGAPGGTPPRLYLVTRGAAAVPGPTRAGLAQSPLWGLAAALDREHPELGVVRIDLPPPGEGDPDEVEALLAEIRSPDGEDRVALRAGGRRVARLARLPEAGESGGAGSRWRVRPDRAYLLTGAFGGLGLLVADWLVGQGARHLHLVGRREPGPLAAEALARWRAAGVCVETDRADVADRSELAAALERGGRALPQLAGVFHLAGMLDDGIVTRLDAARLRRVLRPKVAGAWLLHALLRDQELDAFVLFSSTASLLGHAGQANHAAANAFLDALAHHRRARGQAGLSIHWGPWAEVGAAARGAGEELVARGIEAIRPADGLAVLGDLLGGPAAEVGVAPVHWSRFMAGGRPGGPAPFYEAVRPAGPMPPDRGIAGSGPAQAWAQAAGPERRRLLVDLLRRLAASTLGAEPAQVDVDRPLGRLGLDSLMAVELRHALQRVLTVDVPVVRLMRDASVAGLAAEIEAGSVVGAAAPGPGGVTAGELVEGEL